MKHEKKLIILNGTCGSGKSSVGKRLADKFDYYHIDADVIIKELNEKTAKRIEYNSDEIYSVFLDQIDKYLSAKRNIVLSCVFTYEDYARFSGILAEKDIDFLFIILFPEPDTAIQRTKTKTCFNSITPEYWVRYFHDKMKAFSRKNEDFFIIDNTDQSIDDTIHQISSFADHPIYPEVH